MARPLQVTTKPRCTFQVPNHWFHGLPGETHQCPFPIWRNGRCRRHHPRRHLSVLRRQELKLMAQLEQVRQQLAAIRPEVHPVEFEHADQGDEG